jgi:hypothetical protein
MRVVRRLGVIAVLACVAVLLAPARADAAPRVVVTPSTGLSDGQTVTIVGTGFDPSDTIGVCEVVLDSSPGIEDCIGPRSVEFPDRSGAFRSELRVERAMLSGEHHRYIDCAIDRCAIGASSIPSLERQAIADLAFDVPPLVGQPNLAIKNQKTGALRGEDRTNADGVGQTVLRLVEPGSKWTFAVGVRNDSFEGPANISVTAPRPSAVTVRYFVGYYDVTDLVTGDDLLFRGMVEGNLFDDFKVFAVQFSVPKEAPVGTTERFLVTARSGTMVDAVGLGVRVVAGS